MAPIRIPVPSTPAENKDQLVAGLSQPLWSPVQSPAIANANGNAVDANPKKSIGGCIVIQ